MMTSMKETMLRIFDENVKTFLAAHSVHSHPHPCPVYCPEQCTCSLDQADEPACQGGLEEGLEMCHRKGLCTRFLETWLICIVLDLGDDPGRYGDNRTII